MKTPVALRAPLRLLLGRNALLLVLFFGYVGFYFCRAWLAVVQALLLEDFETLELDLSHIGKIATAGALAYALGKLLSSTVIDFLGGRTMFVMGMCGSVFATLYFGVGVGFSTFAAAWAINQFFQSFGWGALVKIVTGWFSYRQYARAMGLLSLAYLLGDSAVRLLLGALIEQGFGWRGLLYVSAAVLAALALLCWALLKDAPREANHPAIDAHPRNIFGASGNLLRPEGLWALLRPYLSSRSFLLMLMLALGLTIQRETFNLWSVTFLKDIVEVGPGRAAQLSAFFPFAGAISAVLFGFGADFFARRHKGLLVAAAQLLLAATLVGVTYIDMQGRVDVALGFLGLVALFLIGPFTFISGVMAMDIGGRKGSSTAVGLADSAGYAGSIVAAGGVAELARHYDWDKVFWALAGWALVTAVTAFLYWRTHERAPQNAGPS